MTIWYQTLPAQEQVGNYWQRRSFGPKEWELTFEVTVIVLAIQRSYTAVTATKTKINQNY